MAETHICSWIIIDSHKRILLIKRGIHVKSNNNYWAVPSWKCEHWEDFETAAIREVREETGLVFSWVKLYIEDIIWSSEEMKKIWHRYLWDAQWKISLQEEECDGYGWFWFNETKKLLMTSNMEDLLKKLYQDGYIA